MISMMRIADGASIVASFDPSALMRMAQAFISGAMENKAAKWIRRGSFMVLVVEVRYLTSGYEDMSSLWRQLGNVNHPASIFIIGFLQPLVTGIAHPSAGAVCHGAVVVFPFF